MSILCVYLPLYLCKIISGPLIGRKQESYIAEDVIEVDELDEGNVSDTAGKQDK